MDDERARKVCHSNFIITQNRKKRIIYTTQHVATHHVEEEEKEEEEETKTDDNSNKERTRFTFNDHLLLFLCIFTREYICLQTILF